MGMCRVGKGAVNINNLSADVAQRRAHASTSPLAAPWQVGTARKSAPLPSVPSMIDSLEV
jgi:hypothetical protein